MSLSGLNQQYIPNTLDGLNVVEADQIYIDGQLVNLTDYVPYQGASRTIDAGGQNIQTTHTATASNDVVNKGLLDTTISNLSIAIAGSFLDKVSLSSQSVLGPVTYTAQLTADNLVVPESKEADLGGSVQVSANYRRTETDATVTANYRFGSISSSLGVYQATTTGDFATLGLATVTVGKRYSLTVNLLGSLPSYNCSLQLYASSDGQSPSQALGASVSFTPGSTIFQVLSQTSFIPQYQYIILLCVNSAPGGSGLTVKWYGLEVYETGVELEKVTMPLLTASQIPIINDKKQLVGSGVSSTKVVYLDNVSSDIQVQLNGKLNLSGSNANQDIYLGGYKVQSTATPTANADYTTKLYVDNAISGAGSLYVKKAGDTMTGNLLINARLGVNQSTPQYRIHTNRTNTWSTSGQKAEALLAIGGGDNDVDFQYIVYPNPAQNDVSVPGMYWWSSDMLTGRYKNEYRLAWWKETHAGGFGNAYKEGITLFLTDSGGYTSLDYIKLNGRTTVNGTLEMGANAVTSSATPTTADQLTRKGYVDAQLGLYLPLTGGTLSGSLAVGANAITCTRTPVSADDVTRKGYVDTQLALKANLSGGNTWYGGQYFNDVVASRVAIFDASKNLTNSSVTTTTLSYLDATSSIQGQFNTLSGTFASYLPLTGGTVSGTITTNALNLSGQTASRVLILDGSKNAVSSSVTSTTLSYLDIGSSLTGLLNTKVNLSGNQSILGTLTLYGLILPVLPNRAIVSDGSNSLVNSVTTATELSYLSGTTSSVQTQINTKASTTYVDGQIATRLALSGGTMSGVLVNAIANPYADRATNPLPTYNIVASSTSQRLYMGSYYTSGVGACATIQSSDYYSSADHGTPLLLNPLGGVVGIGAKSPGLNWAENAIPNASLTILGGADLGVNGKARISLGADTRHYSAIEAEHIGSGSTTLSFLTAESAFVNDSNPSVRMFINKDGQVGIGTTTGLSTYRLLVNGSSGFIGQMNIGIGGTSANVTPNLKFSNSASHIDNGAGEVYLFTAYQGHMSIGRNTTRNATTANLVLGTSGTEESEIISVNTDNTLYMPMSFAGSVYTFVAGNSTAIDTPSYTLQGQRGYDGSNYVNLQCQASQYGRNQLILTGRYELANDAWSFLSARNAIRFRTQSSLNSAYTNRWTIQNYGNMLGFLSVTGGDVPRMVMLDEGYVGIGTANPQNALTVDGVIQLNNISGTTGSQRYGMYSYNSIFSLNPRNSSGNYNSIVGMTMNSSGNVGLGTINPQYPLHISAGDNSFAYFGPNSSWSAYLRVGAGYGTSTSTLASIASTNGNLHLDAGLGKDFYINYYANQGGSVGTMYSYALDWIHNGKFCVGSNPSSGYDTLYWGRTTNQPNIQMGSNYLSYASSAGSWASGATTGDMILRTNTAKIHLNTTNGGASALIVDAYRVIVNTTWLFDVGNISPRTLMGLGNGLLTGNVGSTGAWPVAANGILISSDTTQTGTSPGLYVGFQQDMGYITCLSPSIAWKYLNMYTGGIGFYWNGSMTAYLGGPGMVNVSDAREKEDIQPLKTDKSLKRVLSLRPTHYRRRFYDNEKTPTPEEHKAQRYVGFLAQEVQQTNPHCVSTWKNEEVKSEEDDGVRFGICYNDYIVHLVGAVQEQQKQIDTLIQRNQLLEAWARDSEAKQKKMEERMEKMASLIAQLLQK